MNDKLNKIFYNIALGSQYILSQLEFEIIFISRFY